MYISPIAAQVLPDVQADSRFLRGATGYEARDYAAQPEGSMACCSPLPPDFIIPRSEWRERAEELERNEASLYHVRKRAGIKSRSQGQTKYCWAHATVNAMRVLRAANGLPARELNPTAVACMIKRGRNAGGNTFDAIPFIAEKGCPTTQHWKLNTINTRLWTPDVAEEAKQNRLTEWWELPANSFDVMVSCVLRGLPVVGGLGWWGHMILAMRLVPLDGRDQFAMQWENSHLDGKTSDDGLIVLSERKSTAFDQAAPRVVTDL